MSGGFPLITDLLQLLSKWMYPHLSFIASSLIATILVIYGARINRAIWALIHGAHFLVRTLVFIALCAFGYGAIAVYLLPVVKKLLLLFGSLWLGPVVILCFVAVGLLAERYSRKG
jgi:cation transport ATPase